MKSYTKYIAKQFGNPSGLGGTIVHFIMNKQNVRQYNAVQDNIHIQPTDTILDIGFGNGYLIKRLLEQNPQKVYGIEISQDMLNKVSRKLKRLISEGKLDLCLADIKKLPYSDAFFDKICTVNTVYFWDDTENSFAEIKRTLKPNGIFVNIFYTKEILDKMHHTQYEYSKYSLDEMIAMTEKSGLKINQVIEIQKDVSYGIVAEKITGLKPLAEMTNEELWQLFPEPHMMFMKGYTPTGFQPPVFHVHVRYFGHWDEIYFRDYLLQHPETAKEYGNLKLKLKEQFEHDRDGYTEAKKDFVQRVTDLAKLNL